MSIDQYHFPASERELPSSAQEPQAAKRPPQQRVPAGQRARSRSSRPLPSPDGISGAPTDALAMALAHESPDIRGLVVDAINKAEDMNRFEVVAKVRPAWCRATVT